MQDQMPFNQFLEAMVRRNGRFPFDPSQQNQELLQQRGAQLLQRMPYVRRAPNYEPWRPDFSAARNQAPMITGSWTPRPGYQPMTTQGMSDPTQGRYYQELMKMRGMG